MTLGQLRNAIDAMLQRGEFDPNLPASVLLNIPNPTKTVKQLTKETPCPHCETK